MANEWILYETKQFGLKWSVAAHLNGEPKYPYSKGLLARTNNPCQPYSKKRGYSSRISPEAKIDSNKLCWVYRKSGVWLANASMISNWTAPFAFLIMQPIKKKNKKEKQERKFNAATEGTYWVRMIKHVWARFWIGVGPYQSPLNHWVWFESLRRSCTPECQEVPYSLRNMVYLSPKGYWEWLNHRHPDRA